MQGPSSLHHKAAQLHRDVGGLQGTPQGRLHGPEVFGPPALAARGCSARKSGQATQRRYELPRDPERLVPGARGSCDARPDRFHAQLHLHFEGLAAPRRDTRKGHPPQGRHPRAPPLRALIDQCRTFNRAPACWHRGLSAERYSQARRSWRHSGRALKVQRGASTRNVAIRNARLLEDLERLTLWTPRTVACETQAKLIPLLRSPR
mmetsp:Transcript_141886/g.395464  ORF Transcript_141886/g.395464 Transcript_141886/m.395464 type:complete len:206 (-) Transcript_141886:333-950(-)